MDASFHAALDQMSAETLSVGEQIRSLYQARTPAARLATLLAVVVQSGNVRDEAARLYEIEVHGGPDRDGWWPR